MKKTMLALMATVGLAFCAKAGQLNKADFESYAEGPFDYTLDDSAGTQDSRYWAVTNAAAAAQGTITACEVAPAETNKYLAVDTNGEILYRSVEALGNTSALNVEGYDIGSGLYLDAEVKFTATEEASVARGEGDKLIVWLYANEEGTTNLMITAAEALDLAGIPTGSTNFVANVAVSPDTWYRLTVKAAIDGTSHTYFNVYLDGALVTEVGGQQDFYSLVDSAADDGKLISAVGFQGTGALDNVVWTTENPFPAPDTYALTVTGSDSEDASFASLTIGGSENEPAASVSKSGIALDTTAITVVAVGYTDGTLTAATEAVGVSVGSVVKTSEEKFDPANPEDTYTEYTYTFTVTITEPAADANYSVALAFEPAGTDISTAVVTLSAASITIGDACPMVTSVTVGGVPLTLDADYTAEYPAVDTTGEKTITLTGIGDYTGTATATFTVTAAEPADVVPGGEAHTTTEEAAKAVVVKAPDGSGITDGEAYNTYASYFTQKVTGSGSEWTTTFELNESGTNAVEAAFADLTDEDAGVLAVVFSDKTTTVTVDVPQGFYWSLSQGASLGDMTNAAGQLSTTGSVTVEPSKAFGASGFYQLLVSPQPIPAK